MLYSVTVVPTPPPEDVAAYKKRGESKDRKSYVICKKNFNLSLSLHQQQEEQTQGLLLSPKSVMGLQEYLSVVLLAACYIFNGE